MKMRFKIAVRSVFRNRRRTALNIVMLAGGVSAIILFRGFCDSILHDLREVTLKTQTGHLQLATKTFWDKQAKKPKEALLPDSERILEALRKNPQVKTATGRLSFFGLVGTSDQTYSARGVSIDPVAEKDKLASFRTLSGAIPEEAKGKVLLGSGLAQRLRVEAGQNVTVLSYTYDNVVNALDLEVAAVITTALSEIDDTTFFIPLETAQMLLDTTQVEQIVVWLNQTESTEAVHRELGAQLKGAFPTVVVRDWTVLAEYYQKCVKFFAMQNRIIELIVLLLVLLGVLNTIGMSVMERTGEIGTVRALGDPEGSVIRQFVLEGAILGAIGSGVGIFLGTGLGKLLAAAKIPLEIPGASLGVAVSFRFLGNTYRDAVTLVFIAAVLAALIPAVRASRLKIVDALRHAI